ncbi:MAG: hypothetical protein EA375_00275 [Acholeplasmataceae bacterium]|nr:MAG: hypothetical protein EA375_00275 [Acholeplasmataceae bacterium]
MALFKVFLAEYVLPERGAFGPAVVLGQDKHDAVKLESFDLECLHQRLGVDTEGDKRQTFDPGKLTR